MRSFKPHRGPYQSEEDLKTHTENSAAVTEYVRATRVIVQVAIQEVQRRRSSEVNNGTVSFQDGVRRDEK